MKKYILTLFSLLALAQVSAWADKYDAHVSALSGNGSRFRSGAISTGTGTLLP